MTDHLRPVSGQQLVLFLDRIGRSLAEKPLEISSIEHSERVAALLREFGGMSFYQLLAIGPAATPERVHEGYERLARMVHPIHAPLLGLEGREDVLEVLFERATAAYTTLSYPGRRRDYDRELGPDGWVEASSAKSRSEENRDRARGFFNRASLLAEKEDYHFAVELLRDAVRIDPQAKYYLLLAQLQSKNEHWLRHAVESYHRVLELGGPDPEVEKALQRTEHRLAEIASGSPIRPPQRASTAARPVVPDPPLPGTTGYVAPRYEIETPGAVLPDDDIPDEN
jgi:tetratricopeptide (TPR) repeat protein